MTQPIFTTLVVLGSGCDWWMDGPMDFVGDWVLPFRVVSSLYGGVLGRDLRPEQEDGSR